MCEILNGKKLSENILNKIKNEVSKLQKKPCLAVILVGNNPASEIYVRNKEKQSLKCGFNSRIIKLEADIKKEELLGIIEKLNSDNEVNGILLQLPLPSMLNPSDFIEKISPLKDVDGFHPLNSGLISSGGKPYAYPCTPKGIIRILKEYNIKLEGKTALVIGRSNIVGKPLGMLLLKENATVISAHSKTENLNELLKISDIVVSAVGKPHFIKKGMIKKGAVVIDVGISRDEKGKITGDVDFDDVKDEASYITPTPGGVGPMTIASLMENTLELFTLQNKA